MLSISNMNSPMCKVRHTPHWTTTLKLDYTWYYPNSSSLKKQTRGQNFHLVLNCGHSYNTYRMAFSKFRVMIWHKKHSYMGCKQMDLDVSYSKVTQKLFGRALEKKMIWPFHLRYKKQWLLHKTIHLRTKYQWSFCSNTHGLKTWDSKMGYKWPVYEPITKLLNLVAKEGFPASWTIKIIQMIFTYGERCSSRNYKTIILGAIFGKLYSFVLEKQLKY